MEHIRLWARWVLLPCHGKETVDSWLGIDCVDNGLKVGKCIGGGFLEGRRLHIPQVSFQRGAKDHDEYSHEPQGSTQEKGWI